MPRHPPTPQTPSQPSSPSTARPATAVAPMKPTTHTLPTPAHSVNGCTGLPPAPSHDVTMSHGSPLKRKRTAAEDFCGRPRKKKAHLEADRTGLRELHLDVGEKYKFCRTPPPPVVANSSEDLFRMFGLEGIAADVARVKPNGEKNALRKTYKGHIKRLCIPGHFDAVRKEDDDPSGFMAMLSPPDHEWDVMQTKGYDVRDGMPDLTLAHLSAALSLHKGPISKGGAWDNDVAMW